MGKEQISKPIESRPDGLSNWINKINIKGNKETIIDIKKNIYNDLKIKWDFFRSGKITKNEYDEYANKVKIIFEKQDVYLKNLEEKKKSYEKLNKEISQKTSIESKILFIETLITKTKTYKEQAEKDLKNNSNIAEWILGGSKENIENQLKKDLLDIHKKLTDLKALIGNDPKLLNDPKLIAEFNSLRDKYNKLRLNIKIEGASFIQAGSVSADENEKNINEYIEKGKEFKQEYINKIITTKKDNYGNKIIEYKNGTLLKKINYKNGTVEQFFRTGVITRQINYKNGTVEQFFRTGVITRQINYKNGDVKQFLRSGKELFLYLSGKGDAKKMIINQDGTKEIEYRSKGQDVLGKPSARTMKTDKDGNKEVDYGTGIGKFNKKNEVISYTNTITINKNKPLEKQDFKEIFREIKQHGGVNIRIPELGDKPISINGNKKEGYTIKYGNNIEYCKNGKELKNILQFTEYIGNLSLGFIIGNIKQIKADIIKKNNGIRLFEQDGLSDDEKKLFLNYVGKKIMGDKYNTNIVDINSLENQFKNIQNENGDKISLKQLAINKGFVKGEVFQTDIFIK